MSGGKVPLTQLFTVFDQYKVSAHYVIPQVTGRELVQLMPNEFGNATLRFPDQVPVIQLVNTNEKAFHAGVSSFSNFNSEPECSKGLNAGSIGIEFHAPGYANGDGSDWYAFTPYSDGQLSVGIALISMLAATYGIPPVNILAHSTISVGRKPDPGPLFPWQKLYDVGFGYLPEATPNPITIIYGESVYVPYVQSRLKEIGFINCPLSDKLDQATQQTVDAYTMQFASHLWEGQSTIITQELLDSLNGWGSIEIVAKSGDTSSN
jgi:N-acetylmuramoyl-L-alanine amidase